MWMSVTLKSVFDVITLKRYLPFRWETSVQWINIPGASDWLTDCRWLFSSKVSCSNYFWKEIDLPHHMCLGREKENWCAIVQPRYLLRSQPLPIWLIDLITPLPSSLPRSISTGLFMFVLMSLSLTRIDEWVINASRRCNLLLSILFLLMNEEQQ